MDDESRKKYREIQSKIAALYPQMFLKALMSVKPSEWEEGEGKKVLVELTIPDEAYKKVS